MLMPRNRQRADIGLAHGGQRHVLPVEGFYPVIFRALVVEIGDANTETGWIVLALSHLESR